MPRSLGRLELALADGQRVVGASSLRHDPARARYPEWTYLPYVTAPDFDEALRRVIAEKDIGGVYTPQSGGVGLSQPLHCTVVPRRRLGECLPRDE
jgi:hypothetical protein